MVFQMIPMIFRSNMVYINVVIIFKSFQFYVGHQIVLDFTENTES